MASAPSRVVQVVTPVHCVDAADLPVLPPPTVTGPDAGTREKLAALLADLEAAEIYAGRAEALLRSCAAQ